MRAGKGNPASDYRLLGKFGWHQLPHAYPAAVLRYRVFRLQGYLKRRGINSALTQQFRSRKTAHRWSTAFHIVNGSVSLGTLRRLEDGRDRDGNLWLRTDWDPGGPDEASACSSPQVLDNATALGEARMFYAEEGYEPDDPRRLPNIVSVPVSRHVYGKAIDLAVEWGKLGDPWGAEARQVVSAFGLVRPCGEEDWHFELDAGTR